MLTQFAIHLICGLSLVWCIMPRSEVTSGFFRIQMLVTLGLSVLAAMAIGPTSTATGVDPVFGGEIVRWISVTLAVLSFLGSVMWTLERRAAGTRFAFAIAAVSTLTVILGSVPGDGFMTLKGNLTWLTELSTAAVSGITVGGMLLGHWYLTQPGLPRAPLEEQVTWLGRIWPVEVVLLLVPPGMVSALNGTIDDGYNGMLGWFWVACAVTTIGLVVVTKLALREKYYSAVMAATGLLYLAILTAFGTDLVARAILSLAE